MNAKKKRSNSEAKPKRRPPTVHESLQLALEEIKKLSKEELAERMTTYEPGVPHYWFGRPVEPMTKEELLAHWNGGPEPEIRYKDIPQPEQERVTEEVRR